MSVRVQGHVTLPISCLNDATPYIALLCILSAACLLLAVQVTKAGPVSLGMNGIQFCITYNGKLSLGMRLLAHQDKHYIYAGTRVLTKTREDPKLHPGGGGGFSSWDRRPLPWWVQGDHER